MKFKLIFIFILFLSSCSNLKNKSQDNLDVVETPTVDYVEKLDVYSATHKDSFLNQLAMNYRSYAIYNARTSGYPDIGEAFANKAITAFSGDTPYPETLDNWDIEDEKAKFDFIVSYKNLMEQLKRDVSIKNPPIAAEAQAKFDCWLSAFASNQFATADECRIRFNKAMNALKNGGKIVKTNTPSSNIVENNKVETVEEIETEEELYYPETGKYASLNKNVRNTEGLVIVNNVNIPENLINPVPVSPVVFNQNIYGNDKGKSNQNSDIKIVEEKSLQPSDTTTIETLTAETETTVNSSPREESISRAEFIDMMMTMRSEIEAINARLDKMEKASLEKTVLKVQQIPLEPKQHVMEEILEVRFDFNKTKIKPEYEDLIKKLATATQENKNIKVSVIGHTDTVGSTSYNYALGGKRAEAVQKMLIKYGIPAGQIVAVSAGEKDNKINLGDGVSSPENRRAKVIKEVHYTEQPKQETSIKIEKEVCNSDNCKVEEINSK